MAADDNSIPPPRVEFPEEEVAELRRRVAATRWPERETVGGDSQGVLLAVVRELAAYWGSGYAWCPCEAELNALPNFTTGIDGLDIHFLHVRSGTRTRAPQPHPLPHPWQRRPLRRLGTTRPVLRRDARGLQDAALTRQPIQEVESYVQRN